MKKTLFVLLAFAALFSLISCDNGSEPTESPANSFSGKTFIGSIVEEDYSYLVSWIEFTSNTDCKIFFRDAGMSEEGIGATYQVSGDVATLKGTGEYKDFAPKTTKLTDNKFTLTVPAAIAQQENDLTVSYAVGNKNVFDEWQIWYDGKQVEMEGEKLTCIYGELEEMAKSLNLEDGRDYTLDTAKKRVELTESGYQKVVPPSSGGSEGQPESGEWQVLYNGRPLEGATGSYADLLAMATSYGLTEGTDYTLDEANRKINLTESGFQKVTSEAAAQ